MVCALTRFCLVLRLRFLSFTRFIVTRGSRTRFLSRVAELFGGRFDALCFSFKLAHSRVISATRADSLLARFAFARTRSSS